MKYAIDLDALKDCLDMLDTTRIDGTVYVSIENVKLFIDKFPKEEFQKQKMYRLPTFEELKASKPPGWGIDSFEDRMRRVQKLEYWRKGGV
jgi:hypothetical protein